MKTGRGFFDYRGGASAAAPDAVPAVPAARSVVMLDETPEREVLLSRHEVIVLRSDDGVSPIVAAPVGEDCATLAARTGTDHAQLVGLDLTMDATKRVTVMSAPGCDADVRDSLVALLGQQRAVTVIADSPGFIAQRICAMVGNLGCEMAQTGLATPVDIDLAMRLRPNYPKGPLELTDAYGVRHIHEVMCQLQKLTGDNRYRPSQWLHRVPGSISPR